jgi:PhnB protein
VNFLPAGYHEVTPYLSVRGAARAIDFYKKAFGAAEVMRMPGPEGKLGHAEIRIGASRVMLSDEYPEMQFMGPETRGGTTVHLHVYVKDVDRILARAEAAGGKIIHPVEDKFYGDRTGSIKDPFGHVWHFATHKEDLSMAELRKRAATAATQTGTASDSGGRLVGQGQDEGGDDSL